MEKGLTTSVLKGANAPRNRTVERKDDGHSEFNAEQGYQSPDVQVDVVNEAAPAQAGGSRPDGFEPNPLAAGHGFEQHAQRQQRERVRSATAEQLAQVTTQKASARR